jgi:hypothetical protein
MTRVGSLMISCKELKDVKINERLGGGQFSDVYKGIWQVFQGYFHHKFFPREPQ